MSDDACLPVTWLLDESTPLPPTAQALGADTDAPGLLAAGGSLSTARLREAYGKGVFPWYSVGQPLMWWTLAPRMVLPLAEFALSRSLRKRLRRFLATKGCEIRVDSAFDRVIEQCATVPRAGQAGTWIVPDMVQAYRDWHRAGDVHSVEVWVDGQLRGGLYAVALGALVCGESMFSLEPDLSKIALCALVALCKSQGVSLIDCQQETEHLASLGARPISRADFERHVRHAQAQAELRWHTNAIDWSAIGSRLAPPAVTSATPATPTTRSTLAA